jgi:basic amino acid/polyamine antiporter, APA family
VLLGACVPALFPVGRLSELINMGTLLAFAIVCEGVWILRRRAPEMERPFRTPFVPVVPILGIVTSLYLVYTLPRLTKEVVFVWLLIGLAIFSLTASTIARCKPRNAPKGNRRQAVR